MAVATLVQYVVQVVAARTLPAGDFGGFGALLACTVVGSVSLLAVQAVVARRMAWSIDTDGRPHAAGALVAPACQWGLALAAVALLTAPAVSSFLHVPLLAAGWLALGLAPLPLIGVGLGTVQGQRRTLVFAALYFAYAALRLLFVTVGLVGHATTTTAMAGVAVGALATAAFARALIGRRAAGHADVPSRHLWPEVGRAALALLAVLALANIDLLMARHRLPALASDQYALGSLAARAVFWLLQFAAVAAYADLSSRQSAGRRRTTLLAGLAVVLLLGAVGVAVAAVVPASVVVDSVGAAYAGVTAVLPWFAALGLALAATQYLLLGGVARGRSATGVVVVAGAAVEAVWLLLVRRPTIDTIVVIAVTIATATAIVLLLLDLARLSGNRSGGQPASVGGVIPSTAHADADVE